MALRSRTRLQLRRTVVAAALGALFVPAVADAKTKTPVITKVTPKIASRRHQDHDHRQVLPPRQGQEQRRCSSATRARPCSSRPTSARPRSSRSSCRRRSRSTCSPDGNARRHALQAARPRRQARQGATRREALAGDRRPRSPPAAPAARVPTAPDGDCDGDGVKNGVDADDDNDLLGDDLELALMLDPCTGDTDKDGVEDGFEYLSAIDLNNDELPGAERRHSRSRPRRRTRTRSSTTRHRLRRRQPDAVDGVQALEVHVRGQSHGATRTLSPLSYSDGQYSISRGPTAAADPTLPPPATTARDFAAGPTPAATAGQPARRSTRPHARRQTVDGSSTSDRSGGAPDAAESHYWDLDGDGYSPTTSATRTPTASQLRRGHGPMTAGWWAGVLHRRGARIPIIYAGTEPFDADSDGDGVRDGADDQDYDDVPNVMELSRSMAGDVAVAGLGCDAAGLTPYRARQHDLGQPVQPVPAGPLLADVPAPPGDRRRLPAVRSPTGDRRSSSTRAVCVDSRARTVCGPSVVLGAWRRRARA